MEINAAKKYLRSRGLLNTTIPEVGIQSCAEPFALATGGLVANQNKILDWDLYDTEAIVAAAGARVIRFFASRQTPAGVAKTIVDTNMPQDGKLPAPQNFTVHGLCFQVLPAINAALTQASSLDLQDLRAHSWWEFKQGQKTIAAQPVEFQAGPGLTSRYNNAAVATVGGHMHLGSGLASDVHYFGFSIAIAPGYGWTVDFHTDTLLLQPSQNYRVRCWLLGFLGTVAA